MLVSGGCSLKKELNAEDYQDYICYDTGFCALNVYQKGAVGVIDYTDADGHSGRQRVIYRKIKNVRDEQFVHVSTYGLMEQSERYILQNPDNYVDIWNDWTVESIAFYYLKCKDPSKQECPAPKPDRVISTTEDERCLAEIKALALNKSAAENSVLPKITEDLPSGEEFGNIYSLRIRVHFKESDNIVWDIGCKSYRPETGESRTVKIEMSTEEARTELKKSNAEVTVDDESCLYKWISTEIDYLYAQ